VAGLLCGDSRGLVGWVLSTAKLAESASAFKEVSAHFINFFNLLWNITNVLPSALLAVSATTFQVVVADFVKLLGWLISDTRLSLLLWLVATFATTAFGSRLSWLSLLLLEPGTIVIVTVKESAIVTVVALASLFPVEALSSRWRLDGVTFRVLVVALVAVSAPAGVTECSADFFCFSHFRDRCGDK